MKMNKNVFVRYMNTASDAGSEASGTTEVAAEDSVVAVKINFNAKYKKLLKDGKVVKNSKGEIQYETVKKKDEKGVEFDERVVDVAARTITANLTAPKFSELTSDILTSLYNDRLESVAKSYVKGEPEESLVNGAEFAYTISASDLLMERVEISEEVVEKAKDAFMQYLSTQGKTDKAQKNNALLLTASVTTLSTRDSRIIEAYENNLTKFVEASNTDLMMEIEAVLTQANRRLEKSKNMAIGDLI